MKRSVSLTMIDRIEHDTQPLAVQYSRERLKPTRSVPTRSSSFTSSTRVSVLLRRRGCEDQRLRSNSSGSAGSGAVSTSPTPLRVSSPTQRVLQLIKQAGMGDQKREIASERQYTTSLSVTKSCDNLETLSLEEGENRDVVAMETGTLSLPNSFLSPCSPSGFDMRSRSRSLTPTPTSPHPSNKRSHITGSRPMSLTLPLGKRRAMDQEEMDVGDMAFLPSSKARLVCVSPLHVAASSSPCTSPICGSPLQKSFSAHHRALLIPPDPVSFSGSTGSSQDGHTLVSSDSEGEGELCLSLSPQHEPDTSYMVSSNVRCYSMAGDHYPEGRRGAVKLNLRFPEDSEEVLLNRRSSSESDANSMADQSTHTPLSPRGLKFLQFPTSAAQLASPVPLPHLASHATPTVAVASNHMASSTYNEPAYDKVSSGSDSETSYTKEPKWKQRLRTETGTKPAAILRSSASSPLVNSAFSMTAGGGGAKCSKSDMDDLDTGDTETNFGTRLFVPDQGSPHRQKFLIQDEESLGFPTSCAVEMTDEY